MGIQKEGLEVEIKISEVVQLLVMLNLSMEEVKKYVCSYLTSLKIMTETEIEIMLGNHSQGL